METIRLFIIKINLTKLSEIGLDGGADKFVDDLRAVIHLPPTASDRPHVDYVNTANQIRGWS